MKRISKPIVLIIAILMVVLLQSCTKEEFYCELEYDGYTFKDNDYIREDSGDYFSYEEMEENKDCPYDTIKFYTKSDGSRYGYVEVKNDVFTSNEADIYGISFLLNNDRLFVEFHCRLDIDRKNLAGEVVENYFYVEGVYFDNVSVNGIVESEYQIEVYIMEDVNSQAWREMNSEFVETVERIMQPMVQYAKDVFYPTASNFEPTKVYYTVDVSLQEKIGPFWYRTLFISCSIVLVIAVVLTTIFLFVHLPDSRKTNEGPNLQVSDLDQMKKKKDE